MSTTLTEAEVQKTSAPITPLIPPTPRVMPAPARSTSAKQKKNNGALFWGIASISLLIAGCSTFLVVRRWLDKNSQENDEFQA